MRIVEIEKIPLQYVTNKATRIKVKAIGRLLTPEGFYTPLPAPSESVDEVIEGEDEGAKQAAEAGSHKTLTNRLLRSISLYID